MFTCCAATAIANMSGAAAADAEIAPARAQVCKPRAINVPAELRAARHFAPELQSLEFEADEIIGSGENNLNALKFRGNARAQQGARGLFADEITYRRDSRSFVATAGDGDAVFYTEFGDELRADHVEINAADFSGEAVNAHLAIAAGTGGEIFMRARAAAKHISFARNVTQLHDARLSNCVEDARAIERQDVALHAKQITLDHARGFGSAKSMTLTFKRIPIFYFPFATFPIDDRRKTGFLFPSAGYAGDSGMIIEAPFYLNLAPNYDARITPRLLSRRGAQLAGQFRYLSAHGRGTLRGEGLPDDQAGNAGDENPNRDRHDISYQHRHARANWHAEIDLQSVSDTEYLSDFAAADAVSKNYITRSANFAYRGKYFDVNARAAGYKPASEKVYEKITADTDGGSKTYSMQPHSILPQVQFTLSPSRIGAFVFTADAEYANFEHEGGVNEGVNVNDGVRTRVTPSLRMPLQSASGFIVPSISLHAIRYSLDATATDAADGTNTYRPSAKVPVYSLDTGLFFDRNFNHGDTVYTQTLEPRLRYLRVPLVKDQKMFPAFDSDGGSLNSIAQLFRDNRFDGGDRIGDTEQITFGIGSRILNTDGEQLLHLQFGQAFYFEERELPFATDGGGTYTADTTDTSAVIAEATATAGGFDFTAFARTETADYPGAFRLATGYTADARRNATLAYVYAGTADTDNAPKTNQLNLAINTPFGNRHQLHAKWAYSLEETTMQSATLEFRFDGCCWAVRAGMQRYLDGGGETKNRFLFTLELADLGRVSSRL